MNKEKLWEQYAQNNIGWFEEWIDIHSHDFNGQVPSSWIQLVKVPSSAVLKEIWKSVGSVMPRFVGYLNYAFVEARIASTKVGYVLVYHLREWLENYTNVPLQGFMAAGLPATEKDLKHFEQNLGILPKSIRELWLIHGFLQRRDESFLTSVVSIQQRLTQAPYPYLNREDNWNENQFLDCLAIANTHKEIVPGLSKDINTTKWEEDLVIIMRYDKGFTNIPINSIDDWLTDTVFMTWLNPGWEE